jgi:hypothetical protein
MLLGTLALLAALLIVLYRAMDTAEPLPVRVPATARRMPRSRARR